MDLWCVGFKDFIDIVYKNHWDKGVPSRYAVISINCGTDVSKDCNEYHACEDAYNVLNLNFDDADPLVFGLSEDEETYTYKNKYEPDTYITLEFFNNKMAKRAVKFIEDNLNRDKFNGVNFIIHCSAGISRSQAFVKFIENVYYNYEWETNPNNPCVYPNGFVFQKLMQAYRSIESNV